MSKRLTDNQKIFMKLIERSMKGAEWATVSNVLFNHTKTLSAEIPDLVEFDEDNSRIRPTAKGYSLLESMRMLGE